MIYKNKVEIKIGSKLKRLRTYKGGEYYDTIYFQSMGIVHETTAEYVPQSSRDVESKNRTPQEMVNSMLSYSSLVNDLG